MDVVHNLTIYGASQNEDSLFTLLEGNQGQLFGSLVANKCEPEVRKPILSSRRLRKGISSSFYRSMDNVHPNVGSFG